MKAFYWIAGWLFMIGVVSVWGRELDPAAEVLFQYARDGNGSQVTGTVTLGRIIINTPDNEGMTALMYAAKCAKNDDEPHLDTCQRCLKLGAQVNLVDNKGYTALHYAKEGGNPRIEEMLIAAGADPNIKPGSGNASSGSTKAGSSSTSGGGTNKGDILVTIGVVLLVIGGLMLVVATFREGMGWGIFQFLFAPISTLFFLLSHWTEGKKGFFTQLVGVVLMFIGNSMGPGSTGQSVLVFVTRPYRVVYDKFQQTSKTSGGKKSTENTVSTQSTAASHPTSTTSSKPVDLSSLVEKDDSQKPTSTSKATQIATSKPGSSSQAQDVSAFMEKEDKNTLTAKQTNPSPKTSSTATAIQQPAKVFPLIEAAKKGDAGQIARLLESGEPANTADAAGWTALMHASSKGCGEGVQALLNKGADVNAKDPNGWTALLLAAHNGNRTIVQALLDKGADVKATTQKNTTALICAAGAGHSEVVQALLDSKAEVNAKDADDKTALRYATDKGHTAVVEILKKAGAKDESSSSTPSPSAPPLATSPAGSGNVGPTGN